jgi:hypothetical protein
MLLSNYQFTEIMLGTVLFPILYFLFLYLSNTDIIYWDIISTGLPDLLHHR